ncbi:hypothetical protein DPMN_159187 [Dreissena polymorpha]|uniref:Uncharacterized protein n=1 Tax=Dreissena polymorpha TaxID=45954 RepID=A0A9D4EKB1_DREPO|nr:hypothetical protein DPMN_159187 [Dreissena polymorpha]
MISGSSSAVAGTTSLRIAVVMPNTEFAATVTSTLLVWNGILTPRSPHSLTSSTS